MFNQKERFRLITSYGREDALTLYKQGVSHISKAELKTYYHQLHSELPPVSAHLQEAICYIEYCYSEHKGNFEDIADWLYTLRAIQRQIEGL